MSLETVLQSICTDPAFLDFWAGAQTRTSRPVQQFLAPYVSVPEGVFHYKKRCKDSRLIQADFSRQPGAGTIEVGLALEDAQVTIIPQAANHVVDGIFEDGSNGDYLLRNGTLLLTNLANEDVERRVLTTAIAAAGSGTDVSFSQTTDDPIVTIDDAIESLILSSKSQEIGVLFGVTAWKLFKRNSNVLAATKGALSYETNPDLFLGSSPYMTSTAFWDTATLGLAENIDFVFPKSSVLLFARANETSMNDPSALKTFRADPDNLIQNGTRPPVKAVPTTDGRQVLLASDWSGEVCLTNSAGLTLLNVS